MDPLRSHANPFLKTAFLVVLSVICLFVVVDGAGRYYGTYTTYGSGDTVIATTRANRGPSTGKRKWHVECLDGEAVIGIRDLQSDFTKLTDVWCKFTFPYKMWTNGLYPYYPDCFVKNYTFQFHCYTPKYHDASVNSFITGFYDDEFQFFVFRKFADDPQPYKCCKTPPGYYVDYQSCYYQPTRDQYGEYYDSTNAFLVVCATGYAVTGIAKKINAYDGDYHIEWIQCCRIGYGAIPEMRPSEKTYSYSSYANASAANPYAPPASYAHQYEIGGIGMKGLEYGAAQEPSAMHYRSAAG